MLPWDERGPMEDSYNGTTGNDFDQLIDQLAVATRDPGQHDLQHIYEQLAVPASMVNSRRRRLLNPGGISQVPLGGRAWRYHAAVGGEER